MKQQSIPTDLETEMTIQRIDNSLHAFHGDKRIKAQYLARLRAHVAADEIIHGIYWENGKGCAVGCTIHSSSHRAYEVELGIPIMLARLEDRIFEGLDNSESKQFPLTFLSAIRPGADLSRVGWKFLYWLLTEELTSRYDPKVAEVIKRCANVLLPLTKGRMGDRREAIAARNAAYTAAAESAADAAVYAADAAADAARHQSYSRMSVKFIALLRSARPSKANAKQLETHK